MKGLKGQAAVSAGFACVTRGLGFVLRLVLGRLMGAEAMGMMEMASGVQQLMLSPLLGALPSAVSRMTAMADQAQRAQILHTAGKMAAQRGLAMGVLCVASAPLAALLLGDMRVLPALWLFAPTPLIVSVCCVMDGFAFGQGRALMPALSETAEQAVRIGTVCAVLYLLPGLRLPLRAAVPTLAGVLGEGAGLAVMMLALGRAGAGRRGGTDAVRRELDRMAMPLMALRMGTGALRSVTGMLMPRLLQFSGLTARQAAAQIGYLMGMVTPLLFLPGMMTGAMAALGGPQLAARKGNARRRLAARLLMMSALAGALGAAGLYMFAPFIGERLYGHGEVTVLLRFMCPGALLGTLGHMLGAMLTGLGRQRLLFKRQMLCGVFTLALTCVLTVHRGIRGAGAAMLMGQGMQCLLLGAALGREMCMGAKAVEG